MACPEFKIDEASSMNPKAAFGHISQQYDIEFTTSPIGKAQRGQIWNEIYKVLKTKEKQAVLEVNCGTGEDAIRIASLGHTVLATDISKDMVNTARSKINENGTLQFKVMDMERIPGDLGSFDMILSNFGGLNCLSPQSLSGFANNLPGLLGQQGVFCGVVMGRKCLWERLYYFLKGNRIKAMRRKKEQATAMIADQEVTVFYYSPKEILRLMAEAFELTKLKPIGLFVPPSYLNPFFRRKKAFLWLLNAMDRMIANFSFLSDYSDHYYFEIRLKTQPK